jgi:hypothetical protein
MKAVNICGGRRVRGVNSPRVDSNTSWWFRANHSVLLLISAACLAKKPHIPMFTFYSLTRLRLFPTFCSTNQALWSSKKWISPFYSISFHLLECNLFSPWYFWIFPHLTLNDKMFTFYSLTRLRLFPTFCSTWGYYMHMTLFVVVLFQQFYIYLVSILAILVEEK